MLCRTPSEIRQRIAEIAKADAISDPALLYDGQTIANVSPSPFAGHSKKGRRGVQAATPKFGMDLAQGFKFEPNPIYWMSGQCGVRFGWSARLTAIWAGYMTGIAREQPADPRQLKALLAPYPSEDMTCW